MMSDIKTHHTNGDMGLSHLIRTDEERLIAPGDLCFFHGDPDELENLGLIVIVVAVATAKEIYASINSGPIARHTVYGEEELQRGDMMAQCLIEGELKWIPFEQLEKIEDEL